MASKIILNTAKLIFSEQANRFLGNYKVKKLFERKLFK